MQNAKLTQDQSETFGIDNILELASQINGLDGSKLNCSKRVAFFSYALSSYYGGTISCLGKEAGDLLYWLSERIPAEERGTISIYPKEVILVMKTPKQDFYTFTSWHSLEEWRDEWENTNIIILDRDILVSEAELERLAGF